MENRTIGHVTPLFVLYQKLPWANEQLQNFEMDFQHYHLTQDERNTYKPKSSDPSKYHGLFYVPKLGKPMSYDQFMDQIIFGKWTFPQDYHYQLEPPETIVPNRSGGYLGLIESPEWKVVTQMWYVMSKTAGWSVNNFYITSVSLTSLVEEDDPKNNFIISCKFYRNNSKQ